jgi:hypothetical protein
MPTVLYRDDNRTAQARINARLAPYPDNGRQSYCGTVVTNPTRTITRCYLGGLQAGAPMQTDEDPGNGYSGGGYGGGNNGYGY